MKENGIINIVTVIIIMISTIPMYKNEGDDNDDESVDDYGDDIITKSFFKILYL